MPPIPIDITIGFILLPLVVLATFSFLLVTRSRSPGSHATLATRRLLAIEMTYYKRNFDVLEGITAVALAIWQKRCGEKSLRHVVLVHGLLSVPYPSQLRHLSLPTFIIAYFPVVWLLTVLVPMAYLLHLVSIKRCLAKALASKTGQDS